MAKLNEELLRKYHEAKKVASDLGAAQRAADAEKKKYEEQILIALHESGKKQAKRGAFAVTIIERRGSVSYKEELMKHISAEQLCELQDAAPVRESLEITEV